MKTYIYVITEFGPSEKKRIYTWFLIKGLITQQYSCKLIWLLIYQFNFQYSTHMEPHNAGTNILTLETTEMCEVWPYSIQPFWTLQDTVMQLHCNSITNQTRPFDACMNILFFFNILDYSVSCKTVVFASIANTTL